MGEPQTIEGGVTPERKVAMSDRLVREERRGRIVKTRQWIARVLVVSLMLGNGQVWAQAVQDPVLAEVCASARAAGVRNAACEVKETAEAPANAPAQPVDPPQPLSDPLQPHKVKTGEPVSAGLGIAGILTTVVGASLLFHWGEDDVRILDSNYCVAESGRYVDYGPCGGPTQQKIGLILIGSGVTMAWIGLRSKTRWVLAPSITSQVKAATAAIRWK